MSASGPRSSEPIIQRKIQEPPGPRFIVIMMVAIVVIPIVGGLVSTAWWALITTNEGFSSISLGRIAGMMVIGLLWAIPISYSAGIIYGIFGGLYLGIRAEITGWIDTIETIIVAILAVVFLPLFGNFDAFVAINIFRDFSGFTEKIWPILYHYGPGAVAAVLVCRHVLIRIRLLAIPETTS